MRDIPMFSTALGAASLTLSQVPMRREAFVWLQSVQNEDLPGFLEECVGFCRAVGAEHVYASGSDGLDVYPQYCRIVEMAALRDSLPQTDAQLWPVLPENVKQWAEIYNMRMKDVPCAALLNQAGIHKLLSEGDGYFVHRGETVLGIGRARNDRIRVIASLVPGTGETVAAAMAGMLQSKRICVDCAEENERAIRLYTRMGFIPTAEVARWYKVF